MKMSLTDLSPVSMVPREHDNIEIADDLQEIWHGKVQKTHYLGEHDISLHSPIGTTLGTESYHVFTNDYSFLHLE